MVLQGKNPPPAMGQVGLCSAQTDSLSPYNSGVEGMKPDSQTNWDPSDIMATLSALLANKSDLNPENLLMRLKCVINENFELRDTITQNNLALRQQMNLFVQWNQQIEIQQRQHRQEVNVAHKKVSALQQENVLLKSALSCFKNTDSSGAKFEELDQTIKDLNQQLEMSEHKLESALEEKENLSTQRTKLDGELTLIKCDLTASRSEFQRLNLQTQELVSTIRDLRGRLQKSEAHGKQSSTSEGSLDAQKLHQALAEERSATTTLLQELKDMQNQVEYLEAELKVSREETSKYKSKYQLSNDLHSPSTADAKMDSSDVRRYQNEAAMLREEVDTLEAALTEERKRTNEERTTFSRLQMDNNRLKKEISESMDRSEKSQYSDQYYQAKLKSVHEMHDEATAKLISYEELLASKNEEVARLKKDVGQTKAQLAEMRSEGDTIAVLRAQVEVYQGDFRAEREAREAMATDREKLRDDMRHLQMRNTQLMDELESYQRRHYNQGPGRSPRSGSEEPNGGVAKDPASLMQESLWERLSNDSDKKGEEPKKEEVPEVDENLLYCPKCNKTFTELRPLEEHVNRCLDED